MVCGERARTHQLHSFYYGPRPTRSPRQTFITQGQGNPPDPTMDLYPLCTGDRRGYFLVFPALDIGVLAAALARYQSQSVWGRDPLLPQDAFDRLRRGLVSGGFIRQPTPYSARVDNSFALRVLAE